VVAVVEAEAVTLCFVSVNNDQQGCILAFN
jgi:hypothetical protein